MSSSITLCLVSLKQGLSPNQEFTRWSDCLTNEVRSPVCVPPPCQGHSHAPAFPMWSLRIRTWLLIACSEGALPPGAVSPAPVSSLLESYFIPFFIYPQLFTRRWKGQWRQGPRFCLQPALLASTRLLILCILKGTVTLHGGFAFAAEELQCPGEWWRCHGWFFHVECYHLMRWQHQPI